MSGVRTSTVTHNSATKTFHIRLYTVTELVEMLRRVGFSHVHALGSLDGATLTPATRLTLRAVR